MMRAALGPSEICVPHGCRDYGTIARRSVRVESPVLSLRLVLGILIIPCAVVAQTPGAFGAHATSLWTQVLGDLPLPPSNHPTARPRC